MGPYRVYLCTLEAVHLTWVCPWRSAYPPASPVVRLGFVRGEAQTTGRGAGKGTDNVEPTGSDLSVDFICSLHRSLSGVTVHT